MKRLNLVLWFLNKEMDENKDADRGFSQIILIGDAPPNSDEEVKARREGAGAYWKDSKNGPAHTDIKKR